MTTYDAVSNMCYEMPHLFLCLGRWGLRGGVGRGGIRGGGSGLGHAPRGGEAPEPRGSAWAAHCAESNKKRTGRGVRVGRRGKRDLPLSTTFQHHSPRASALLHLTPPSAAHVSRLHTNHRQTSQRRAAQSAREPEKEYREDADEQARKSVQDDGRPTGRGQLHRPQRI
jgi:hypothetical protein